VSYAIWHQPEYGAGLRSPDRAEDRHTTHGPRRRRPRLTVLAVVAALLGLGATDALTASGPATGSCTPVDRTIRPTCNLSRSAHVPSPPSTPGAEPALPGRVRERHGPAAGAEKRPQAGGP
jgi:hypothetical protein